MTLGETIQQLRKAAGISQEQLAEQLEVSRQSISKWERNEAVPEIGKIMLLSELFSISTDELLKGVRPRPTDGGEGRQSPSALEQITRSNGANRQILSGFWTMVAGLVMLVLELLFLPIFGTIQKAHVNGQGFYSDFIKYAGVQPMPLVFAITAAMILIGLLFLVKGLWDKGRSQKKN